MHMDDLKASVKKATEAANKTLQSINKAKTTMGIPALSMAKAQKCMRKIRKTTNICKARY